VNQITNLLNVRLLALLFLGAITGMLLFILPPELRAQDFDVQHYHIYLNAKDSVLNKKQIEGRTAVSIISKTSSLKTVTLELKKLIVKKVEARGKQLNFNQVNNSFVISLGSVIGLNDTLTLHVSYGGQPAPPSYFGGVYFSNDIFFTIGIDIAGKPHNAGKTWYPCVDNFSDKATYSFCIETSGDKVAICNGLMISKKENNSLQTQLYCWELPQAIPTYLASVAVGNYSVWKSTYRSIGGNNIPIEIYTTKPRIQFVPQTFENLPLALQIFEDSFGPYPFNRVGYVGVPFAGGAMEHATNIAFPLAQIDGTKKGELLFVHELAHAWFGNWVTCSSSGDMWLNEGFASFCEGLYIEKVLGLKAYENYLIELQHKVLTETPLSDGGLLPVCCVDDDRTYGSTVYDKGAWIAHTLRHEVGDSAFFAGLRAYFQKFAFGNVTSGDLCKTLSDAAGRNLEPWFEAFVYQAGPIDFQPVTLGPQEAVFQMQSGRAPNSPTAPVQELNCTLRLWSSDMAASPVDTSVTLVYDVLQNRYTVQVTTASTTSWAFGILDPDNKLADATICQQVNDNQKDTTLEFVFAKVSNCSTTATLPTICWTQQASYGLTSAAQDTILGYWQVAGASPCEVQLSIPVSLLSLAPKGKSLRLLYKANWDSPIATSIIDDLHTIEKSNKFVITHPLRVGAGYYIITADL